MLHGAAIARLGLGGHSYVAFLGAKEPRKNVPNLIRGWVRAVADQLRPRVPKLAALMDAAEEDADRYVYTRIGRYRIVREISAAASRAALSSASRVPTRATR